MKIQVVIILGLLACFILVIVLAAQSGGPAGRGAAGAITDADFQAKPEEQVVTTPSGLKYVDLRVGDGAEAKTGRLVTVHYTGKLKNGKQFDSSVGKDPYPVPLGARKVIAGWDEGLVGMKVGGKRRLIVPPALGYAEAGFPPDIPPNAELLFVVEVVEVK
jgi:FKBP-type peptidyl-prolyl cis-trans isomerase